MINRKMNSLKSSSALTSYSNDRDARYPSNSNELKSSVLSPENDSGIFTMTSLHEINCYFEFQDH